MMVIARCFGYFLIFMILLLIAVALGEKPAGWIVYSISALVQLLILNTTSQSYSSIGFGEEIMVAYWITYVLLLILAGLWIAKRWRNR